MNSKPKAQACTATNTKKRRTCQDACSTPPPSKDLLLDAFAFPPAPKKVCGHRDDVDLPSLDEPSVLFLPSLMDSNRRPLKLQRRTMTASLLKGVELPRLNLDTRNKCPVSWNATCA